MALAPVRVARATSPEPLWRSRLESDAWQAYWDAAPPEPPAPPCPVVTPHLANETPPPEPWKGPVLRVGERDHVRVVIESGAHALPNWTIRLDPSEGLRVAEGEPWEGAMPPGGLVLEFAVEAVKPGRWRAEAHALEDGRAALLGWTDHLVEPASAAG